MISKGSFQKLEPLIKRLNEHILSTSKSPYLPDIKGIHRPIHASGNLTPIEAKLRKDSLIQFQNSPHFRNVSGSLRNDFMKNLYPMRNSLCDLSSNTHASREVNHGSLFRSYCALPQPGVAHMNYEDFEHFMQQMFDYRAFSKPNSLSGTNILFFKDEYIIHQYADAHSRRQAHLNTLWHITNDLEAAKIPLSDYERRNMVYKTFFRDRKDIIQKIKSIISSRQLHDAADLSATINEFQSPNFDFETYKDVASRFGDATDTDTLHVLLFTALRHDNTLASIDIMAKLKPCNFTRNTYKILLENLAFNRNIQEYMKYLSLLISDHIFFIDIQLINIIISSLINLDKFDLAQSIFEHLYLWVTPSLSKENEFLKLLKRDDKMAYKSYLTAYDNLSIKPAVKYHPTEQSVLPILKYLCESENDFDAILKLLVKVETDMKLPMTSQIFKHVFRSFTMNKHDIGSLRNILAMLVEAHDTNSGAYDTWIREQINNSVMPSDVSMFLNTLMTESREIGYTTNDNNFIKLSNGLVRQVFLAYYHTVGPKSKLNEEIMAIETELNDALKTADERHKSRIHRDQIEAIDLHERDELVYLKKTYLLRLLEI